MPTKTQIDSLTENPNDIAISYLSTLVGGGYYINGYFQLPERGGYWSNTAYNGAYWYLLNHSTTANVIGNGRRTEGFYIRCVQAS